MIRHLFGGFSPRRPRSLAVPDARHRTRTATTHARTMQERPHDQAPGHPRGGPGVSAAFFGRNYRGERRTTSSASAAKTRKESRIPATCVKCRNTPRRTEQNARRSPRGAAVAEGAGSRRDVRCRRAPREKTDGIRDGNFSPDTTFRGMPRRPQAATTGCRNQTIEETRVATVQFSPWLRSLQA